ncbi:TPA: hypothetical protein H1526_003002 [Listeria monocytogenes]|uniref:hypothetical protein n=1 Tax=Listeria monocytogenes TaxID=1639 RepID=UPI000E71C40B|nr:hypothetical protein [Listeria monocytogenes]EAC7044224.1 hypothetical protein [Listeria monocytogenes]EAD8390817.1 hypothetical protein [Listeria monocytogenes]RKC13083.1 hypothetical protein AE052_00078 [Listeria monocytogenes]HAK0873228.1 hypothetical protein [Listeria monocytogenes]HAK0892650.1 hypothetical protein [Listeria monocytogenes]
MEFMSMIVTGIVLGAIISGLSFVVGKLSGLSWFWIAFCANSGFFIIFITVQNSFPDNAAVALSYLNLGIGVVLIALTLFQSSNWLFKKTMQRKH